MTRIMSVAVLSLVAAGGFGCANSNPVAPAAAATVPIPANAPGSEMGSVAGLASRGQPTQLVGRIEGFPSAPPQSFVIDGQTVETDESTTFLLGNQTVSFADLEVGQRVQVRGTPTADGLLATTVRIQNTQASLPGQGNVLPAPPPADPLPAFNLDPVGMTDCRGFTCGFLFSPLADITVQTLGQWDEGLDGLPTTSLVSLWAEDGTLLASATIPNGTSATLVGAYRYAPVTPVTLVAGERYVIGSAFVSSYAPLFDAADADPAVMVQEGRFVYALAYPIRSDPRLFGGANFQFLPGGP